MAYLVLYRLFPRRVGIFKLFLLIPVLIPLQLLPESPDRRPAAGAQSQLRPGGARALRVSARERAVDAGGAGRVRPHQATQG